MKTKEEIEKLAEQYANEEVSTLYKAVNREIKQVVFNHALIGFKVGYEKCQEDMADYLFEVARQFHRLGKYSGHTSDTHFADVYEETINSLNKQE